MSQNSRFLTQQPDQPFFPVFVDGRSCSHQSILLSMALGSWTSSFLIFMILFFGSSVLGVRTGLARPVYGVHEDWPLSSFLLTLCLPDNGADPLGSRGIRARHEGPPVGAHAGLPSFPSPFLIRVLPVGKGSDPDGSGRACVGSVPPPSLPPCVTGSSLLEGGASGRGTTDKNDP